MSIQGTNMIKIAVHESWVEVGTLGIYDTFNRKPNL